MRGDGGVGIGIGMNWKARGGFISMERVECGDWSRRLINLPL